jgi:hypothetical protein
LCQDKRLLDSQLRQSRSSHDVIAQKLVQMSKLVNPSASIPPLTGPSHPAVVSAWCVLSSSRAALPF